jgi:phosphocarrier protein
MGLHARPSTQIVQTLSEYDAKVTVSRDGLQVDAHSVLDLLMLAAECGATLQIEGEGPQAEEAIQAVQALVEGRFGELDVDL